MRSTLTILKIVYTVRENKGITLQNGWFVVQNRGPNPASPLEREQAEKTTLSKPPWIDIPEQQRGTAKLKVFLANILCTRIREAFPDMHRTIAKSLAKEKENLASLGDDRSDPAQRREYLLTLVGRYQELTRCTLKSPEELAFDEMKLRGMAHHAAESFAEEMRLNGNSFEFLEIADGTNGVDATPIFSRTSLVGSPCSRKLQHTVEIHLANLLVFRRHQTLTKKRTCIKKLEFRSAQTKD
jgi:hypothetical protein